MLAARRVDRLEALGGGARGTGVEVLPVACDVTDSKQVDALKDACLERFGKVDILVNNAGTTEVVPAENESDEAFLRVLNVNLNGSFYCAQRFGRVMLEAGRARSSTSHRFSDSWARARFPRPATWPRRAPS